MKTRLLFIFIIITVSQFQSLAQNGEISGTVVDSNGESLPGAYVTLNNSEAFTTDNKGKFRFTNIQKGNHHIEVSYLGFEKYNSSFKLENGTNLTITLIEDSEKLEEVIIAGESESQSIKNSSLTVSIVEAKKFYERSVNVKDLLNNVSGVQVRQSGGLGNNTEVSIQGLSGRQVKIFIDNIPINFLLPTEELGIGAALATVPVTLIERIEVYKGATPVGLGSDALGGAINLVTRRDLRNFIEFTATRSSFNGLNSTINFGRTFNSGFYTLINGQYSSSDNDYQVDDVTIVNDFGNPELISANKFHDRFRSYLINASIGLRNKKWADLVSLNFTMSDLYDEIQHNFEMRQPYGQALNSGTSFNIGLKYEKYQLAKNLDVEAYLGYNRILSAFTDTTLNIYDWKGNIIGRKTFGGEITSSQNLLNLTGNNLTGRIALNYTINKNTKLVLNSLASSFERSGQDPVAEEFYGVDYFKEPVQINRVTSGLGLEHTFFSKKVVSKTAFKHYGFFSEGFFLENGVNTVIDQNLSQYGFSQSLRWKKNEHFQIKSSYEYATRLPDRIELLGDFSAAINANPGLIPETSHNLNLGFNAKKGQWKTELNGFYRNISDIIILQAVPPPVLSKHENLLRSSVAGIEGTIDFQPYHWLSTQVNITYQDIRNKSERINAGVSSDRFFGVRLPNRPYLFGNSNIQIDHKNLLSKNDRFQFWVQTFFVQSFFRFWEIDGRTEDKLEIPEQWLHNAGLAYTLSNQKITFSLESQNLSNNKAFDNFRVQKPGRSWHFRIRLFTNRS